MPTASGDRFSSSSMSDCAYCHPDGRRFRTQRQCAECGKPLCLVCRPEVPGTPFVCPDCGGGPCDDAIHKPDAVIQRIQGNGNTVPFWLTLIAERLHQTDVATVEAEIVPE